MDAGIISTRYARAIYEYAQSKGEETNLYDAMRVLSQSFIDFPDLGKVMNNPTISLDKKIKVLQTGCGIQSNETLKKVIQMIVENGRANYMRTIALVYDEIYRKAKGLVVARLTTVTPATEDMEKHLSKVVAMATGDKVEFHSELDSDIIGGFILQIGDKRLDASVKEQLNQLRLDLAK